MDILPRKQEILTFMHFLNLCPYWVFQKLGNLKFEVQDRPQCLVMCASCGRNTDFSGLAGRVNTLNAIPTRAALRWVIFGHILTFRRDYARHLKCHKAFRG